MQSEGMLSVARALGLMAMFAIGLVLGAAAPVLAGAEVTTTTACSTDEVLPVEGSEWAVPPMQTRPGEPY